jgi:hypothetical protein
VSDDPIAGALGTWLAENAAPAPDTRMSTSRVMAGVELTPQLGRFWPPRRLAPQVGPMPVLGADDGASRARPRPRPRSRPTTPHRTARVREVVTPVRALAVFVPLAFVGGLGFILMSLLPEATPAVAVAAPSAPPSPQPTAAPATVAPTLSPTAVPSTPRPPERPLVWRNDDLRLEADSIALTIRDATVELPPAAVVAATDGLGLGLRWTAGERDYRLVLEVKSDKTHWWVARVRTHDGTSKPRWIYFGGTAEATRTPLGSAIKTDLTLASTGADRKSMRAKGSAQLAIERLHLIWEGLPG